MKTEIRIVFVLLLNLLTATLPKSVYANLEEANFKYMLRGYCYAASRIVDTKAPGGYGSSNNFSLPIGWVVPAIKGKVILVAQTNKNVVLAEKYIGMKLHLINATRKKIAFEAQDSRLAIIQEALDENGEWKPVEYLPSSWCGNSYHQVFLGPNEYWSFAVPRYAGSFKTKLRFKLEGVNPIYSNEFEGSINKEQLSIQQGHSPTSIMDPYVD